MRIINLKHSPPTPYVYCGADSDGAEFNLKGKPSAYIKNRLGTYRRWLFEMIKQENKQIMALMRYMTDESVLVCHCVSLEGEDIFTKSEVCHTQIVWKAWRYLKSIGKI